MGQVTVTGTLVAGSSAVSASSSFPSMQAQASFGLRAEPSSYSKATGVLQDALDSPSAYVQLAGIDATIGTVKRATFLYLRAPSAIWLRITTDDGIGGEDVIETPHQGLFIKEWPDDKAVLLLEAKGESALEYFASGPA